MPRNPLQTILYVEDENDIREIAMIALEDVGGMKVYAFANGPATLLAAPQPPPDLLLLDVMMPGMDGPTLLASLRQQPGYGPVPAIFMTAKVQPSEVGALLSTGAVGVIAKPFDPMTLADEIRRIHAEAT